MNGVDLLDVFATPIVVLGLDGVDDLNDALTATLLQESERVVGLSRSNVGAWHSVTDLMSRPGPMFAELTELITDAGRLGLIEMARRSGARVWPDYRLGIQAWAMVVNPGDYLVPHDHADAHLSGVYYVDAGDADQELHPESGLLAFMDPRGGLATVPGMELFPSTFTVEPFTGVVVMFPSFLTHYVHPYRGTRPRVSVSFNIRAEPIPPTPLDRS